MLRFMRHCKCGGGGVRLVSSILWSHLGRFSAEARKKSPPQKFFIFWEMELSCPTVKKVLIFSRKKRFLYFGKRNFSKNNILYFRKELSELKKFKKPTLKKFLMFREMQLSSPKLKKLLIFQEGTSVQKKNVTYTFPYKEAKFSKIKYFLIIMNSIIISSSERFL